MSEQAITTPRVLRVEIHYDDGSKDEIRTVPKAKSNLPLYVWSRSSSVSTFKGAYTAGAIAAVVFQTLLTRRLMDNEPRDKDTTSLLKTFGRVWCDADYTPPTKLEISSE